jgi:phosphatidate phosphatase APP1
MLRTPPVRLQPYFGYRSRTRLVIAARALRAGETAFEKGGRWQAFRTMVAQFASREAAGLPVTLEVKTSAGIVRHDAHTNSEGFVHFDIPLDPLCELPAHPAWEVVELRWSNRAGPQRADGHVLAPGRDARLAVISDIDDTIIETGVTGGWRAILRNWRRLLLEFPADRIAVPGADVFYAALGGGAAGVDGDSHAGERLAATNRPFFYISSSPWNLFSYLVAFKRAKGLPVGPLLLRDWGLNSATFTSGSHGAHKASAIRALLDILPDLRFALIGDDTQGDLPAYAEAAARYGERIAGIFIRTTTGAVLSAEEFQAKEFLETSGVPLWMGDRFEVGFDFLERLGFTPGGETEQIVRAVEKLPPTEV